jgi:hypothetical protein
VSMSSQSKFAWVGWYFSVLAVNAIVVFALIPAVSRHMKGAYNVNVYADGYDQLATNLAEGHGYRFYPDTAKTLLREPGYPIVLAGIFLAFGKSFTAVKLANLLLALLIACLMTQIARKVSSNRLLILGPPVLFLLHPETLIAESRGGVEILFAFMLTAYVLSLYKAVSTNRWRDYLVSGIVLGLTVLVRSTPILFPLFLLGYLLFGRRKVQVAAVVGNVAVMVMAMFLVLSPWIIRNYRLTAKFVPTASVLGVSAQAGLYLSTHHAVGNAALDSEAARERNKLAHELGYHFKPGYYQYFYSASDELAFSHYLFAEVMDQYKSAPRLFVGTVLHNLLNFWCGGKTWRSVALDAVIQIPLILLAVIGVLLWVRSGRVEDVAPLVLLIIYILAVSLPILAQARYCGPLIPFLSILAWTPITRALRESSATVRTFPQVQVAEASSQ